MKEIDSLIGFLNIICNRPDMAELFSTDTNHHLSSMNSAVKEFMSICDFTPEKESKQDVLSAELSSFINDNYELIYSYEHRREYESRLNTIKRKNTTYFYRGVSNNRYPISSGIYRSNEQHEENYYFNEISVRCPMRFAL